MVNKTVSAVPKAAAITTLVRLLLQAAVQAVPASPMPDWWTPSPLVKAGALVPAFVAYGLLTYGLLAWLYAVMAAGTGGLTRGAGRRYGMVMAALWFVYLWEPLPHWWGRVSGLELWSYPLADGLALLCLGWLLERHLPCSVASAGPNTQRSLVTPVWTLATFAGSFLAVRWVTYQVWPLYTSFHQLPGWTMCWVMAAGLTTGLGFVTLKPPQWSAWRWLAFFVGLVAVNLAIFNGFMALVIVPDVPDLLTRSGVDVVAALLAGTACSWRR